MHLIFEFNRAVFFLNSLKLHKFSEKRVSAYFKILFKDYQVYKFFYPLCNQSQVGSYQFLQFFRYYGSFKYHCQLSIAFAVLSSFVFFLLSYIYLQCLLQKKNPEQLNIV